MKDVAGVAAERSIRCGRPCTIGFASGAKDGNTGAYSIGFLLTESVNNRFRSAEASACIIDTQTVKTAAYAHRDSGYDNAKNHKDRKRSIVTDTQGSLFAVVILRFKHRKRFAGSGASPLAPVL